MLCVGSGEAAGKEMLALLQGLRVASLSAQWAVGGSFSLLRKAAGRIPVLNLFFILFDFVVTGYPELPALKPE